MHHPGPADGGHRTNELQRPPTPTGLPPPLGRARARDARPSGDAESLRAVEILSHELRSPITTIQLGTKVLRDGGPHISDPLRREIVEAVEEEAERLYRLVENLLAIARHDGTGPSLAARPLLLQHWLPGVIAAAVDAAPSLRVRVSIPPPAPPVLADDGALDQVVRNVLSNVVRHAPDGMPAEVVAWAPEDGILRLEVLDRGPGIEPDDAEHVFEPFFRTPSAITLGSGAGLGLTAARRLLGAMDGRIEALARPGGGTRIVIRLPLAVSDDDAADDRSSDAGRTARRGAR